MEIDAKDSNSGVAVKSETMECTTSFEKPQSCYGYCSIGVEYKKAEHAVTIKEEKYEGSNTGIAPNDIRIKLDLSDDDDLKDFIRTNEESYKCDICSKSFATKVVLQRHTKRTHMAERNYKCAVCTKCFITKHCLSRHIKSHTEERNCKCEVCGKCFKTKLTLLKHVKTHTGERMYECETCNRRFKMKYALSRHAETHNEERNYKCEICGKCFITKRLLSYHVEAHNEERNYKCEICGKCFKVKHHLSEHVKTHNKEKNYKCKICSKCFTKKSNLSRHIKTHSRKVLLEHVNIHTEENEKEGALRSFPCIVSTSTTEEINDIDKQIVKKEADPSLNKDNLENNFGIVYCQLNFNG